ncbi:hypothetical protein LMG27177_06883 [Paraburkholderia fynbosensis]|uniref:SsuA/THI5-like domain-containing protein n=2 Tax=Paraburkholderia fynbosensis TaxID=1200993 RepID=A0A6J5H354_9BURK|nr:hypothetical protein LMG27177_06883 [Paraburkholderia fynbosensis]
MWLATLVTAAIISLWAWSVYGDQRASRAAGLPHVTIALTGVSTNVQEWLMADALGYFEKAGVDVTIENYNGSGNALAVSGQVPLVIQGVGGAMKPAIRGIPIRIVYSQQTGDPAGAVTVATYSPFHDLMDLSGRRVGTISAAGSCWGSAALYSDYIVRHGGKPLQVTPYSSPFALSSALNSGQIDAAICTADTLAKNIDAGNMRNLLSPSNPVLTNLAGDAVQVAMWGTRDAVEKNREAIVRAVGAAQAAAQQIPGWSIDFMAKQMSKLPIFLGYSEQDIRLQLEQDKPYASTLGGYISRDQWQRTLDVYKSYALRINLKDDALQYDKLVDASISEDAGRYRDLVLKKIKAQSAINPATKP